MVYIIFSSLTGYKDKKNPNTFVSGFMVCSMSAAPVV